MAYGGTDTAEAGMAALMQEYYDKVALETLVPELVAYNLCEKKKIPKNSGKIVKFHRYTTYSGGKSNKVSAFSLTEGGSGAWPTWTKVSAVTVSATLLQYGDAKQTTDLLDMTAVSDMVTDTLKVCMMEAADIIDQKVLEVAYGTSCRSGSDTAIPSGEGFLMSWPSAQGYEIGALSTLTSACIMDVKAVKEAVKDLKVLNAQPRQNGYYAMIAHPVQTNALMNDSAWQNAYQYTDAENLRKGHVGKIYGVEVFETTNIHMTASGTGNPNTTSAYFAVILGRGALAATEIDGGNLQTYVKRPNQYDTANPLNQWSSIGWKITFVPVILNASAGRILVTADG